MAARVARNVRRRRRDADLSRRGLAIRAGLSEQTVGAVERGAVWPDLVTLAGLAAALGADVRDLLDG